MLSGRDDLFIRHLCILYTNCAALPEGNGIPPGNAVYPIFSRINHSCIPNAVFFPTSAGPGSTARERPWMAVRAVRDLAAGEELTVAYVRPGLSAARRADKLDRVYGFQCTCGACQGPRAAAHEADRRTIRSIDEALRKCVHDDEADDEALALAEQRVSLLNRTGLVGSELVAA